MAGSRFLLLCDFAAVTQDGKLVVAGIFEKIFSTAFPARHSNMHIVASMDLALGRHHVALRILGPNGQSVANPPASQVDTTQDGATNYIVQVRELVLPSPGKFTVEVYADNAVLAKTTFDVVSMPTPSSTSAPKPA